MKNIMVRYPVGIYQWRRTALYIAIDNYFPRFFTTRDQCFGIIQKVAEITPGSNLVDVKFQATFVTEPVARFAFNGNILERCILFLIHLFYLNANGICSAVTYILRVTIQVMRKPQVEL